MLPLPLSGTAAYAAPFWTAFFLWLLFEGTSLRRRRAHDSIRRDRGSLALLGTLAWVGVLGDFACALWLPEAAIPTARTGLFVAGVLLMPAGVALRWHAMRLLGRFFTYDVAVLEHQPVIEEGPYRYVRHPAYSGALLTFLGLGLALGNGAGLLLLAACLTVGYGYRIAVEEAALADSMGDPYRRYMSRTRRLVPYLF